MFSSIQSAKVMGLIFSLSLLAFVAGWPAEAAAKESIRVEPDVIDTNAKKIKIHGSGFSSGSQVTVGFPDVPVHKDLPFAKGIWVSVITVDKTGAFSVDVELRATLWRLSRVVGKEKIPGTYNVRAKNMQGESAATTLVVKKAKAKKK
jgi:hypothetical protein